MPLLKQGAEPPSKSTIRKRRHTAYDCCPTCGVEKQKRSPLCMKCAGQLRRSSKRPSIPQPDDPLIRHIPLTQGKISIVDAEEYEFLMQRKWLLTALKYAGATTTANKIELMHRVIMKPPSDMEVDHINHNTLDNRKCNLRVVPKCVNAQNTLISSNNTSGFKGVSFDKSRAAWMASISSNGKQISLGRFPSAELAARAYDDAARRLHGPLARLNFPKDGELSVFSS
jgi:hypothetical protein